jgi:hypothetical protein
LILSFHPHPVILSEAHRGPRRAFFARWGGERSRRTPRILPSPIPSHPFNHNRAAASAVASEIGPGFSPDNSSPPTKAFSPWDFLA